jgi:hypothetical protein
MTVASRLGRASAWLACAATLLLACDARPSAGRAETVLERQAPSVFLVRVLERGVPLAGVELEVETTHTRRRGTYASVERATTDERGFLRVARDWPGEWRNPGFDPRAEHFVAGGDEELRLTIRDDDSAGVRTISGPLVPGETALGDLALEPLEVLVAGRVLAADGAPVAGAAVAFIGPEQVEATGLRTRVSGRVTAGADGAFTVYATDGAADSLRVVARDGERVSAVSVAERGERELELTLSATLERVAGRVLLDPEIPIERIDVQLWDDGRLSSAIAGDVDEGSAFQRPLDPGGSFEFRCLPGEYRVRVVVDWHTDRTEIPDVRVASGTTDLTLDLRGRVRCFRLTLAPPASGAAVRGRYLAHVPGRREGRYVPFEGPDVLLVTVHPALDIELDVDGCRLVELTGVDADRTVALEAGWPIRLVLMDHIPLPDADVSWSVILRVEDEPRGSARIPFAPGEREARAVVSRAGRYELEWLRSELSGDDVLVSAWGSRREGPAQLLVVQDAPGEQTFEIAWVPAPR